MDGVIEVGHDGAFDISAPPAPPVQKASVPVSRESNKPSKSVKPPPAPVAAPALADWEIKKQRGNKAFSDANIDLAVDSYTAALTAIEVTSFRSVN